MHHDPVEAADEAGGRGLLLGQGPGGAEVASCSDAQQQGHKNPYDTMPHCHNPPPWMCEDYENANAPDRKNGLPAAP
jgi:hypothetical protein